jgi:hypothetical protein
MFWLVALSNGHRAGTNKFMIQGAGRKVNAAGKRLEEKRKAPAQTGGRFL